MTQCAAKSKQSGERCQKKATPGFDVCHIHGSKTPSKHGAYSKKKMIENSLPDNYTDDLILVLQDQLKEAIERQRRIKQADDRYYDQIEKNDLNGLDLSEISQSGTTVDGIERKTVHRKRDFSQEYISTSRLIKELSKTILDMKKDLGIVDNNEKIVFDIKLV